MFESQTGIKVDKLMAYWTREDRFIEIPRLSAEKSAKSSKRRNSNQDKRNTRIDTNRPTKHFH